MINNIREKVNSILNEKKLIPQKSVEEYFNNAEEQNRRFLATVCSGADGREYFFKILIAGNQNDKKAMENEINFHRQSKESKTLSLFVPAMVDFEKGEFDWYLRDSVRGNPAGDAYETLADKLTVEQASDLAFSQIQQFQKITDLKLEKMTSEKYLGQIQESVPEVEAYFPDFLKVTNEIFNQNRSLLEENHLLCHGDYHCGNFIFTSNRLFIIDWAHVHYGNIAEDFAKLWVSLWQFPVFQKKILLQFLASDGENLKKSLHLMLLFHASDSFRHWARHKKLGDLKNEKEGFNYFHKLLGILIRENFLPEQLI